MDVISLRGDEWTMPNSAIVSPKLESTQNGWGCKTAAHII